MYIDKPGAYLALCDHYLILFRAVGSFPHLKIPSGIILNDYGSEGTFREVLENSPEIQGIYTNPERYVYSAISNLSQELKPLDFTATEKIAFDKEVYAKYSQRLRMIDAPRSGLHINSLAINLMTELNYSLPQAYMFIQELRKKLKEDAKWPYQL